jgi:hypothetical protein
MRQRKAPEDAMPTDGQVNLKDLIARIVAIRDSL